MVKKELTEVDRELKAIRSVNRALEDLTDKQKLKVIMFVMPEPTRLPSTAD